MGETFQSLDIQKKKNELRCHGRHHTVILSPHSGGCCLQCKCGGRKGKCCHVPYYIRDPNTMEKLDGHEHGSVAAIDDLWAGVAKECCNLDNYTIRFPRNATPEQKATLFGSVFLLEMIMYEVDG